MNVLITCGGTAGHINPGLALAGRVRELRPDTKFLFVGAKGHMETELVPREGFDIVTIPIDGFQRSLKPKMLWRNVKTFGKLLVANAKAGKILREFQPDVAVGTGGYVCYPVLRKAARRGIPTAVHESNAVPGLTTQLLEPLVDCIMVGFPECREHYRHKEKVCVTGTPVRVEFHQFNKESARAAIGIDASEPLVLVAFGSLGARRMNAVMEEFIAAMGEDAPFRLVYATGRQYYSSVCERLEQAGSRSPKADIREYIYDMPRLLTAADLMICRSGASTVGELCYLGKPAVIVPSPNVVNHHQEKNAAVCANAGSAVVFSEAELTGQQLYDTVVELLSDPARLTAMETAGRALCEGDATENITTLVLSLAKKEKMV